MKKTFTHQEVQEILRSGQKLSGFDHDAFTAHLAQCPECQSYADMVKELHRTVPIIYPPSSLSVQEIRQKAKASQHLLWRKSMLTRLMRGTTALIWLGASLVILLILVFVIPHLLPRHAGGFPSSTVNLGSTSSPTLSEYTKQPDNTSISVTERAVLPPKLATTVALTATSIPLPTNTQDLPQEVGDTIILPHQHVHGVVLDDHFIYYSSDLDPRNIMRQPLDRKQGSQPEIFVKTQPPGPLPDGNLTVSPRLLINHWLYYVDYGNGTTSPKWTLRAIHTVTRSEKIIVQGNTGYLSQFQVDGNTIALNMVKKGASNCTEENILETINFLSGQPREINRLCKDTGYYWLDMALSGDHLLAFQATPEQNKDSKTVLFDLKSGGSQVFALPNQSKPVNCGYGLAMTGPWVACNIAELETSLYNLSTHQSVSFKDLIPSMDYGPHPVIQDHWLYWTGSSNGNIYDLTNNRLMTVRAPKSNEIISEMYISGTKVAWLIVRPNNQSWEDVIGWIDIPSQ